MMQRTWLIVTLCLPVLAGERDLKVNRRDASVSGVVFLDANANGRRDAGERGMPGVRTSDGELVQRTDADGRYSLALVVDWHRFVMAVAPSGYRPTTPWAVRLAAGDTSTRYQVDFGLAPDAASAPGQEVAFLATADSQFVKREEAALLREEFAQITDLACGPRFFVIAGDLTMTGTYEQFDHYLWAQEPFTIPVYNVFGGHDGNYGRSVAHFEEKIGPCWFAWECGGCHFVAFVAERHYLTPAAVERQKRWLDNYMSDLPDGSRVITVAHYPLSDDDAKRWGAKHRLVAHIYGHWHEVGLYRTRGIDLLLQGPIRGKDWGALTRCVRVCRLQGAELTTELRATGQYKRLELIHPPQQGTVARGRLPVQILAYDTATWVRGVECRVRGAGRDVIVPMRQTGQWTWAGELDAAGLPPGRYTASVRATSNRGESWPGRSEFTLADRQTAAPQPTEEWPSLVPDPTRGRAVGRPLLPPLSLAWVVSTGGGKMNCASPVVSRGRVFVATMNDEVGWPGAGVSCHDATTGKRIWHTATAGSIAAAPTVHAGRVYVLTLPGEALCLRAADGRLVWRRDLYGETTRHRACKAPVVVHNGLALAKADGSGPLYVLDAASGEPRHAVAVHSDYMGGPAVHGDVAYVAGQRTFSAISLATGAKLWEAKPRRVRGNSGVVYAEGRVYSCGSGTRCLDAQTGEVLWVAGVPTGARSVGLPLVHAGRVYCVGSTVCALDAGTGKPIWRFPIGQDRKRFERNRRQTMGCGSSPLLCGRLLYFGGDDGSLYALDADTGKKAWEFYVGTPIKSHPALSGNALYLTDYDGNLYCFVGKRGL